MPLLLEHLPDRARELGAVTAVRDRADGAWRFLSWSELQSEVNRLVGALAATPRGERYAWSTLPGSRRLALDLAVQHLGVVSAPGPLVSAEAYASLLQTREEAGRLVRALTELRPRDPAVERGSAVLDHGAVLATAQRAAALLGGASLVLVSAPAAEPAVGWGALVAGYSFVVGGPELLASQSPEVWVATAEQVSALGLERPRLAALGGMLRSLGRGPDMLGRRLAKVFVSGPVPAAAEALRAYQVEVAPWAA